MTSPERLIGKQINQFRLESYIARGAMGMVFKAYDTVLLRPVALKIISDEEVRGWGGQDKAVREEACKRLIQEAKAAGRLHHPNVVTIYSYGRSEKLHFICMEFVSGKTLTQLLHEKAPLDLEAAFLICEQILLALDAATREQIVHRDIKPSNIMITPDGCVKVMDFGIAKLPSCASTAAGTILGTPYYMSPEQVTAQAVDIRSDLFSLGTVLYQMLAGELPFEGESTATITYKILHEDPAPLQKINETVPRPLAAIVAKALQKDVTLRYQTPGEMLDDLRIAMNVAHLSNYRQCETTEVKQAEAGPEKAPAGVDEPDTAPLPHTYMPEMEQEGEPSDRPTVHAAQPPVEPPLPTHRDDRPDRGPWFSLRRRPALGWVLAGVLAFSAVTTVLVLFLLGYRLYPTPAPNTPGQATPTSMVSTRIDGRYSVTGVYPNGNGYQGTAIISGSGGHYTVNWTIASQAFTGSGVLAGDTLTVKWNGSGMSGTAIYTLKSNGALQSSWGNGKGMETLVPLP